MWMAAKAMTDTSITPIYGEKTLSANEKHIGLDLFDYTVTKNGNEAVCFSKTNQVIDKLGFDFRVIDDGEKYATIKCTVDVSYTFYAWCFTFGEKMQILAPDDVKSGYQKKQMKNFSRCSTLSQIEERLFMVTVTSKTSWCKKMNYY